MATRSDPTAGISAIDGYPYWTDLACGHWPEEVAIILRTLEFLKLDAFVEIGVHVGGLADIILQWAEDHQPFVYLGIENNPSVISREIDGRMEAVGQAAILIRNAWDEKTVTETMTMLSNPMRLSSFIYCDGGNKPRELKLWAPYAVKGDVVGVHDYGDYSAAEIRPSLLMDLRMKRLGFKSYWPSRKRNDNLRIALWKK